ncbi:MAG: DOMON-like domain-containing protein [Gammaproteobacteria bacterium]|nr:DOMON-like domain-containing protein [Gammaproteobacteria bacterium]MBU1722510.1 DOMON-like domain-containing protein [Gammaproteobacteria bacterium]MBU2007031.1 DOMON-like domain-containing protein [Gammaproteobacteria bacterium]
MPTRGCAFLTLHCHPATPCAVVHSLQVSVEYTADGSLHLQYTLQGELAKIRIPEPQAPLATDGLWEHTCFEAFIAVQGESGYHEFNFSPSRQWAAYAFSGYRERVEWRVGCALVVRRKSPSIPLLQRGRLDGASQQLTESLSGSPPLQKEGLGEDFLLEVSLTATNLPPNPERKPLQLGLTAVIETITGEKSYWALKHSAEHPDFHHRNGFTHEIWP